MLNDPFIATVLGVFGVMLAVGLFAGLVQGLGYGLTGINSGWPLSPCHTVHSAPCDGYTCIDPETGEDTGYAVHACRTCGQLFLAR